MILCDNTPHGCKCLLEADFVFCVVSINTAIDLASESTNASADIVNQYKLYVRDRKYNA